MIVIDGENCVLGRLASYTAKEALKGEEVNIVNADKIIILGNPKIVINKYVQRRNIKDPAKPVKSPKFPRRPDLFVKKAIRGMLPWKSRRGRDAFRKIRAYMGVPKEFEGKGKKIAELRDRRKKHINIYKLCKKLGWGG